MNSSTKVCAGVLELEDQLKYDQYLKSLEED